VGEDLRMGETIEVHRGSVQTWECDHMGHLNVRFYVDKAMQGLVALVAHLGVAPRELRDRGWAVSAGTQHIRFLREQRSGAPYFVRAGVLGAEPSHALSVVEEMVSVATGDVAATFVGDCAVVDARTREAIELPDGARERARALLVELPAHARPRGIAPLPPRPRPTLAEAEGLGLFATYQATVADAECDASGHMTACHYMGAVSDSIPNLLLLLFGIDRSRNDRLGGAALEYRFVYHSVPRAGDVLALRSGLAAVADKTYRIVHWLFDAATGLAVATAEAVAVAMDLDTRRAIAIPDDVRARLERAVIPGLTF